MRSWVVPETICANAIYSFFPGDMTVLVAIGLMLGLNKEIPHGSISMICSAQLPPRPNALSFFFSPI